MILEFLEALLLKSPGLFSMVSLSNNDSFKAASLLFPALKLSLDKARPNPSPKYSTHYKRQRINGYLLNMLQASVHFSFAKKNPTIASPIFQIMI